MSLHVQTFNLRYADERPPNAWAQRFPVASECLRRTAPDVVGTQEGFYGQIQDLAGACPEFDWIGVGREGGSRGEFGAIFFRTARLVPLEFDFFWLSDTPDVVGSTTWGNRCVRMATGVKLRDLQDGREFWFWNTHLDHESQFAREQGAVLLSERLGAREIPTILVGDFNADARANPAYDTFMGAGWSDTWFGAKKRAGQNFASFHGYAPPVADGPHIDWILTHGAVLADQTRVVDLEVNGQYPSDHFPISATLRLGEN